MTLPQADLMTVLYPARFIVVRANFTVVRAKITSDKCNNRRGKGNNHRCLYETMSSTEAGTGEKQLVFFFNLESTPRPDNGIARKRIKRYQREKSDISQRKEI